MPERLLDDQRSILNYLKPKLGMPIDNEIIVHVLDLAKDTILQAAVELLDEDKIADAIGHSARHLPDSIKMVILEMVRGLSNHINDER